MIEPTSQKGKARYAKTPVSIFDPVLRSAKGTYPATVPGARIRNKREPRAVILAP
jgi:hypothetical protein